MAAQSGLGLQAYALLQTKMSRTLFGDNGPPGHVTRMWTWGARPSPGQGDQRETRRG